MWNIRNSFNITIIVPVYGDWSSLSECIESLKRHIGRDEVKIIFVNDCGPDADCIETNILRAIRKDTRFKYYRNPKNLGFVKTCNRAVYELDASGNDILLLNSDTRVTRNFLEEMISVLRSSEKIAAVCPRSNNATIFSVPINAQEKKISPEESYRIFRNISRCLPKMYQSPIAHGFCMMIRRSVIDQIGLFDEVYGKGYGEENDFCMRALKHGYICTVANRAFVFHFKGRSFTSEERAKLIAKNEKVLDRRYPKYRQLVIDYMKHTVDPLEYDLAQRMPSRRRLHTLVSSSPVQRLKRR